ncbi:hypothetical protein DIS13_08385 [Weissella paramesenteroides]|uniref:hypothetical protein n=1 Tax=Weissella paramesenteroides TaxID=1249 RepID=UPI00112649A6|nr:hypothetical protein [Weissella paramesenteroides]TPF00968.1 hypothetical protein DIS13_08385 [Weissella paramesenteroides]
MGQSIFEKDMADNLNGLDQYMTQQEQKLLHGDVHNDEYADIQDKLNQLNNSNTLDEIKRIELVKASIMFEMLRSIDQLTESIQELNQDSNY